MLDTLTELYYDSLSERYPSFPRSYHPSPKFTDTTANGLTRCVIEFLRLSGHQAERISSSGRVIGRERSVVDVIGVKRTIGSTTYIKGSGVKGTADVSSTINVSIGGKNVGLAVKWEVKIGRDRQSKKQREYEKSIQDAGGHYYIVKSFDDFFEKYSSLVNGFK